MRITEMLGATMVAGPRHPSVSTSTGPGGSGRVGWPDGGMVVVRPPSGPRRRRGGGAVALVSGR
jgi:hypothetical protein